MDNIILWIMAIAMVLGALDRMFGSRLGLGKQFEEGILAIGALSLSMLGILTLAPVLARLLRPVLVPVYGFLGADPAMFAGSILANDMGGAPLAMELAGTRAAGQLGGLIVGSMLGRQFGLLLGSRSARPSSSASPSPSASCSRRTGPRWRAACWRACWPLRRAHSPVDWPRASRSACSCGTSCPSCCSPCSSRWGCGAGSAR